MENKRQVIVFCVTALLAACGGNGETSSSGSGASGAGNAGSGGSGTGTGGGNGGSGTGTGGGNGVCHPTLDNGWCAGAESCECLETLNTSEAFCTEMAEQGLDMCPPDGNTCEPGHNRCGYDLPKGEDYIAGDCESHVSGDTWVLVGPGYETTAGSKKNPNNQLVLGGVGSCGSENCNGLTVSGKKLYGYRFIREVVDTAEGEFSEDCRTITMRYYPVGSTQPSDTEEYSWLHD
ncbi:hypothetical protein HY479_02890 [Candidatus Uhrbacteria bacterium]|nr:hypothetical protein [Candidatus Uhrbacteria bacterium]